MELADIIDFLKEVKEAGKRIGTSQMKLAPRMFLNVLNVGTCIPDSGIKLSNIQLNSGREDGRCEHSFEYERGTYKTVTDSEISDL